MFFGTCWGATETSQSAPPRLFRSNDCPPANDSALDRRVYLLLYHEHQGGRQHPPADLRSDALYVATARAVATASTEATIVANRTSYAQKKPGSKEGGGFALVWEGSGVISVEDAPRAARYHGCIQRSTHLFMYRRNRDAGGPAACT